MQVNEDGAGTKIISIRSNFAGAGPAINVTTNDPLLFLTNNSEQMRLTSTALTVDKGAVFNESGGDFDFRVESDINTHALFLDATVSRIGINNAAPATSLAIFGATDVTLGVSISPSGWNNALHRWTVPTSGDTSVWSFNYGGTAVDFASYATSSIQIGQGAILFGTGSTGAAPVEKMRIGVSETVFNEQSLDYDFRVESDNQAHMLFVDAGGNTVSINSSTNFANSKLFVDGPITANYADTIALRYNVSGQTNAYYKGMTGTNPSGASARGLHIFNYDQDSDQGINFWSGVPGGTVYPIAYFGPGATGAVVFNDDGLDRDFRVESDTQSHIFFVDAGNNRVAVGTSTPASRFDVYTGADYATLTTSDGVGSSNAFGLQFRIDTQSHVIGQIRGNYVSSGAGGYGGMNHYVLEAGSLVSAMYLAPQVAGGTVFNDGGVDLDFRVESDTNTHALFVDASANAVFVGGTGSVASGTPTFLVNGYAAVGVGLATANPSNTDLLGTSRFSVGGDGGNYLAIGTYTNAVSVGTVWLQSAYYVPSTATYSMVLNPLGGNVGIGRVSSQAKLHVENAVSTTALQILQNSNTRASGVYYGMEFRDNTDEANANIVVQQQNSGNNAAQMEFYVNSGTGGNGLRNGVNSLTLYPSATVFNEGGIDQDFRVESDGNENMLFVNAGTNRVSVGTTLGSHVFNVVSSTIGSPSGAMYINAALNGSGEGLYIETNTRTSGDNAVNSFRVGNRVNEDVFNITVQGNVTVNEGGGDNDFRVESDANTHALFVDAGTSNVGVMSNAPRTPLEVRNNSGSTFRSFNGLIQRGVTNTAFNILQANNLATNVTVGIYFRILASSPVTNDAAVIEGWAAASRQSGGSVTYTTVAPVVSKVIAGSNIAAGSLAWSGDVLQYTTDATVNYVGYHFDFQVVAVDGATITFFP
jgi:hypothetical protein